MGFLLSILYVIFFVANLITELNYWGAYVGVARAFFGWFGYIVGPIVLLISNSIPLLPFIVKITLPWINSFIYGESINWFSFFNLAWMITMLAFIPTLLGVPIIAGLGTFEMIKGLFNKKND